jgi:hypothetical protein
MARSTASPRPVGTFGELHRRLEEFRDGWIFRGHSDASWRLVPKVGRAPYRGHERFLFDAWKRRAAEYLAPRPVSDWEWLAIAQHHLLATRLLDWTTNPLVAAYFAVGEPSAGPAVVYAARFAQAYRAPLDINKLEPWTCGGPFIFRPGSIVPRITRQGGLFTVHDPPDEPLRDRPDLVALRELRIESRYRPGLLSELAFYGITSASLFPDLDGLSRFLNWSAGAGELSD